MRSESRWRDEDLDEYEEEDGEGYEEEGEEEEEEEDHKPTQEELDYLKMRERLKEKIRQNYRKENGGRSTPSSDKKRASANAEFGSFFGPSRPVIARRVIEESHSICETQHIAAKVASSHSNNKRAPVANGEQRTHAPRVVNELKSKVEALKDMRDYSFLLSDDAEIPAPSKEPLLRNSSTSVSAQSPTETKIPMSKPSRPLPGVRKLKKPMSSNQHAQHKPGFPKTTPVSSSRPSGSGPGRPPLQRATSSSASQRVGLEWSSATAINKHNSDINNLARRPGSSSEKYYSEQRRQTPALPMAMVAPKQAMTAPRQAMVTPRQQTSSSKPQQLRPQNSKSQQFKPQHSKSQQPNFSAKPQRSMHEKHLKWKPIRSHSDEELDDDGDEAINMIRQMFRYNPNKYGDDDDDSDMEANFDDIMKEERRSSKIARQEDEEQLRLIEEEEKRERMRSLAKKHKQAR